MATPKTTTSETIYQMKVTLIGSGPPIWRRFQVASHISLRTLHRILQEVMGWSDYHLHQFAIGEEDFGEPSPDYLHEMKDDKTAKLNQVIPREKTKFMYEYDFGDGWEHEIFVEKILPAETGVHYPVCLAGERACPPEDCGGIPGYEDFLKAIRNPKHEEHSAMLDWIGGRFDPEAFDLGEINRELKRLRGPKRIK
ncbi:MAG: plasmid pRiA4b ORF-3 family protein [Nitrospinota bacterium]